MKFSADIVSMFESSFWENADSPALTDYFTGNTYTYLQLAESVRRMHLFFRTAGVLKGDRVALIGKNNPRWVITYVSVVTYGAVIVPVLSDFNPVDAANIIAHSGSVLLFSDNMIWQQLSGSGVALPALRGVISNDDGSILSDISGIVTSSFVSVEAEYRRLYPDGFTKDDIRYATVSPDDIMIISYTSGTTGFSKGVMLTVGNITANVCFALDHRLHFSGSRVLALLPLAHAYGCAFDMLSPLAAGSHITLLGRMPSPSILLSALKKVRPHLVCTVPLVMEKIIRRNVVPQFGKRPVKCLVRIPGIRSLVYRRAGAAMKRAFGGCIMEVNMGGASLAEDVEAVLRKLHFPYTVGYGMTECGPLISYEGHGTYKPGSCGRILPGMEVRVAPLDGGDEAGEICVRGVNVMAGYYLNPEATAAAIDAEGWLHTGDVGVVDDDGTITLRGRCKSMILTSSGQNIYPEEIEAKLNELPLVSESLVYDEDGKIIALIVPDKEEIKAREMPPAALVEAMDENLRVLNTLVAPYERVSSYKLCGDEFEKTPKRSIKRYLYPKHAVLLIL